MTPSEATSFKSGEKYNMLVLGAHQDNVQSYINVEDENSGQSFKVEVKGILKNKIFLLQGQHATVVCTGLTEKGPEFVLDVEYFEQPVEAPRRGANLGLKKSPTLVFQRSFFLNSVTNQPDDDQPFAIAKQIAAFMNTRGGDLFLGVDDEGFVTGVESDFPLLNQVTIMMDADEDKVHSYSPDIDGYIKKIANALITYLGQDGASFLPPAKVLKDDESGLPYLWLHAEPSPAIVYLGREEEVYFQSEKGIEPLCGRKRDIYVKERFFLRGEKSATEALEQFKSQYEEMRSQLETTKAQLQEALLDKDRETVADPQRPAVIVGQTVPVSVTKNRTRGPNTNLKIILGDGRVYFSTKAARTLASFIEEIGVDTVAELGVGRYGDSGARILVKSVPDDDNPKWYMPISCGYYLLTKTATTDKKAQVEAIARKLNINLNVEIIYPSDSGILAVVEKEPSQETEGADNSSLGEHSCEPADATEDDEDEEISQDEGAGQNVCQSYIEKLVERGWKKDHEAVQQLKLICIEKGLLHEDKKLIPLEFIPRVREVLQHNGIDSDKYYRRILPEYGASQSHLWDGTHVFHESAWLIEYMS